MALSLLDATKGGNDTVAHTPSHDLESIVYVIGYTVLYRLVNTAGCPNTLEEVFNDCFGKEKPSRTSLSSGWSASHYRGGIRAKAISRT